MTDATYKAIRNLAIAVAVNSFGIVVLGAAVIVLAVRS